MAGSEDERDALAQLFLSGEPDAFRDVLLALWPIIARRLTARFGRLLSPEDVEDIWAAAAYRLWDSRERFDPGKSSLSIWSYLIARSAALDFLRRRKRFSGIDPRRVTAVDPSGPSSTPVDDDDIEHTGQRVRLEAILDELPETDRTILLTFAKHEGEGMWAQAAADMTGLSVGNVRVRKMRLIDRLRRPLQSSASPGGEDIHSGEFIEMPHEQPEPRTNDPGDAPKRRLSPEYVKRLEPYSDVLRGALKLIKADETAADFRTRDEAPERLMGRIWHASEIEGPLRDSKNHDKNREALLHAWAWNKAVHDTGKDRRDQVREFAKQCRDDPRLEGALLFRDPPSRIAERIERGAVGLADAIEEHMPAAVRRQKTGEVQVSWKDEKGWLDGECFWSEAGSLPSRPEAPGDRFRLSRKPDARCSFMPKCRRPSATCSPIDCSAPSAVARSKSPSSPS
jgi:RNA polymerase sigma factor (sigma-70 family)